jgi:hypothetical protein
VLDEWFALVNPKELLSGLGELQFRSYLGHRYRFDDAIQPAICVRALNPSLFMMLRTWVATVGSEISRRAPICLFARAFGDITGSAVVTGLMLLSRTARPERGIDGQPNDNGASPPEEAEGSIDDEYVLALAVRLRELDPHADFGELDFDVDESHVLLRAIRAGEPIHPELQPSFQRVQRQRELVEAFAVAQLQRELEFKRLEHRRRALQQHQALLHQHLREAATAAERIELGPALTHVAHEISRIDEALRKPRSTFAVNGGDGENAAGRGHPGVERQAES